MNLGKAFKLVQFNLLQQAGISVSADQLGLKPEDLPGALGVNGANSPFANVLNNLQGRAAQPLTPPVPPEDPSDVAAQKQFNEEMVAYNQRMYAQNQQLLQQLMIQLQRVNQAQSGQGNTAASGLNNDFSSQIGTLL